MGPKDGSTVATPPTINGEISDQETRTPSTPGQPLEEICSNQRMLERNEPFDRSKSQTVEVQSTCTADVKEILTAGNTTSLGGSGTPNGRVPYRVGLSRRTRIPPLLRVVRK